DLAIRDVVLDRFARIDGLDPLDRHRAATDRRLGWRRWRLHDRRRGRSNHHRLGRWRRSDRGDDGLGGLRGDRHVRRRDVGLLHLRRLDDLPRRRWWWRRRRCLDLFDDGGGKRFLDYFDRLAREPGHQRINDDYVDENDERNPDQMPGRVSLLPSEIHLVLTPVARRRSRGGLLLDELFAADDADLGQPEALCRRHYSGDNRVLGVLVRTKVQLGLDGLGGSGLEIFLKRSPIGQRKTVPVHHAGRVDVDLDDLGQDQRRRRIANRHIEIDRMQLDRNGDDEHDQ